MAARRDICSLSLISSLLLCPAQALAGNSASANGQVGATLVEPITLTAMEPLHFGVVAVSESEAGSITVDPDSGSTSYSGGLGSVCPVGSSCFARPALFGVTGEAGRAYRIDAPATAVALYEAGGAAPLAVTAIEVSAAGGAGGSARRVLDDGGSDSFRVGGTLVIPGGTQPGIYRAELSVVVSYD